MMAYFVNTYEYFEQPYDPKHKPQPIKKKKLNIDNIVCWIKHPTTKKIDKAKVRKKEHAYNHTF